MSGKTCLNCGHKTHGKFCSNCGQKSDTHRLDWHYVWHDLPHSFLHLDKGIFYTFKQLTTRPGVTINEFLDGKRSAHFRPLMYLIITGTITGLIYLGVPQNSLLAQDAETVDFITKLSRFQGKYFNLITIGFLPVTAFLAWLFYRKHRNYVELMVTLFFVTGHTNLIAIISLLTYPIDNLYVTALISLVGSLLTIVYFVVSFYRQFSKLSGFKRIFFPVIIAIINNILLAVLTITLFVFYMMWTGQGTEFQINYGIE